MLESYSSISRTFWISSSYLGKGLLKWVQSCVRPPLSVKWLFYTHTMMVEMTLKPSAFKETIEFGISGQTGHVINPTSLWLLLAEYCLAWLNVPREVSSFLLIFRILKWLLGNCFQCFCESDSWSSSTHHSWRSPCPQTQKHLQLLNKKERNKCLRIHQQWKV